MKLRVVPPAPWQLAADASAPHLVFFEGDDLALTLSTSSLGLGLEHLDDCVLVRLSRADLARLATELERRSSELGPAIRRYLEPVGAWKLRTQSLETARPLLMGIVNLTDDSFSGDGVGDDVAAAVRRADALRAEGASIIDAGAESARADRPVREPEHEAHLMGEAVKALTGEGHIVSADTYKPLVAQAALAAGAEIVNDISGLTLGAGAAKAAANAGAGYVLNYSYSEPKRRPPSPPMYEDVVTETNEWLATHLATLGAAGLAREAIVVDPGIAFGKSHDEDLQVMRRIGEFTVHGQPILLAHSRKNYIGSVTGAPPTDRDLETHLTTVAAYAQGARIFRVHDVAGARRALELAEALFQGEAGAFAPDGESWPWRAGAGASHMTRGEPDKAAPSGQRW